MPSIPIPQQVPIDRANWSDSFNGNIQMPNNDRTPVNPIDIANQQGVMQSQNALRQAQTINSAQDAQQKQRSFQLSMLNGVMSLPPEQQADALSKVVPMMNRMGPTQFDSQMTPAMAKMYTMSNVPTEQIPQYQMMQGQAGLLNALRDKLAPQGMQGAQAGGMTAVQTQGQPQGGAQIGTPMPANGIIGGGAGSPAPIPAGGGSPIDPDTLALMAAVKPDMANAMVNVQKLQYDSPQGKQRTAAAEDTGKNQAEALKGVTGIDSRIQNAIDILNDQIKLAPNTATGQAAGGATVGLERNIAGLPGAKQLGLDNPDLPKNQSLFEQNNANLFTQELPAIIAGSGGRTDIPLVNAIKQASSINEYGTPQEKIAAAQNLKGLLMKYQENIHNNASQIGAGNIPIPKVNDPNAPGQPQKTQGNVAPDGTIIHDGNGTAMVKRNGQWVKQ